MVSMTETDAERNESVPLVEGEQPLVCEHGRAWLECPVCEHWREETDGGR
jgi:hypothetical protein